MAAEMYSTATEYTSNALTFTRGGPSVVTAVGVYHDIDPEATPAVEDFTIVQLVDGEADPNGPLAQDGVIDVVALIGPKAGADEALTPGVYYRWVLIQTEPVGSLPGEDIIRRVEDENGDPDTLTVV